MDLSDVTQSGYDRVEKRKLPFDPTSGKKLQAFIGSVVATPKTVIAELRSAFKDK